jgi:hypothetical protein
LIASLLALGLLTAATDAAPAATDERPLLTIDACVEVDVATVREVMALELRDLRTHAGTLPAKVSVRCVGEAQEIRLDPPLTVEQEEVRTLQLLPVADAAAPAARQARSRELALAIAELVRRRDAAPPPPAPESPQPAPAAPPVGVSVVASRTKSADEHWQLGVVSTFEHFAGGQSFAGGDALVALRLGSWFRVEARAGARLSGDQSLSAGHLSARAGAVSAAAGVTHHPEGRAVGFGLMLRMEGRVVEYAVEDAATTSPRTARLGAFLLAVEPRLQIRVTRHFTLEAAAGAGFVPHGIVVRDQGLESRSVSGLVLSGSLGGGLTF